MIWADMDFEERMQAIYRGTRDGKLAKQIAHDAATTTGTVLEFARSNGLAVRTRMPAVKAVKIRRRKSPRNSLGDGDVGNRVNPTFAKRVGCAPDSMMISSRPLFRNEAVD